MSDKKQTAVEYLLEIHDQQIRYGKDGYLSQAHRDIAHAMEREQSNDQVLIHTDEREADVQKLCKEILKMSVRNTGDHGSGGECPFCFANCSWQDELKDIVHKPDCIYLIAKDLSTNM